MTPELRKAAAFVLENPNEVGVSSMREIAEPPPT
jgi:DNA-binding MurR/RpiR family transcriptional regulator